MKKWVIRVLLAFFPVIVFADSGSSLSFAPPASDSSMVFLGNLFGIVDGVLHGTGSQIMGAMFNVFNAAVLSLGGIIIMYTLIVSTLNTAHEGQMLGQKWSSIWIPVRSVIGLALLIPKASGYCLMQIFVMWVVTQGVGAADKVWEAALSYLNRGGVIIQSQGSNIGQQLIQSASNIAPIPQGALTLLVGQVCMLGLQKKLEMEYQASIQPGQKCNPTSGAPNDITPLPAICNGPVPDFLSTVNFVSYQQKYSTQTQFNHPLPDFTDAGNTTYSKFDSICGTVSWKPITQLGTPSPSGAPTALNGTVSNSPLSFLESSNTTATLNASEFQIAQYSRAIAIQQMYVDLSSVAQAMVSNDPSMSSSNNSNNTPYSSGVANQQFGMPYTNAGILCESVDYSSATVSTCANWGPDTSGSANASVLFNGTEFVGAILDYNGIMAPTINLINSIGANTNGMTTRDFINGANSTGWIMAGSYFFNLVFLNGNAAPSLPVIDTQSGLESSTPLVLTNFTTKSNDFYILLTGNDWFNNSAPLADILALIDGSGLPGGSVSSPVVNNSSLTLVSSVNRLLSSTVYGFINNSLMVQPPPQPGVTSLTFANHISVSPTKTSHLSSVPTPCDGVPLLGYTICIGEYFYKYVYNYLIVGLVNKIIIKAMDAIKEVINISIKIPLEGIAAIFRQGLSTLQEPGTNPIIALANMGVYYINFASDLWLFMIVGSALSTFFPPAALAMALLAPILLVWVSIMIGIGFITAYYIPMLPYMIFTFGSIAWLISVIEAMVAAPIVALGVTHPEGHDAFGKGEQAVMLLMNVFLRPGMMIIGYISAIALSYVGIWILNAGFDNAISFIQADTNAISNKVNAASGSGFYTGWAATYAFFFSVIIYTSMYLTIVQKSFTLISYLPDKVLRWIGGNAESLGAESAGWGDKMEEKIGSAGKETADAQGQAQKQLQATGTKKLGDLQKKFTKQKGEISATGADSKAEPPAGEAPN